MRDDISIIELVVSLIIPNSLRIIPTNHITEYVIKIPYIIIISPLLGYTYSISVCHNFVNRKCKKKYPS